MEGAQRREARSSATNPLLNSGLNSALSFSDFTVQDEGLLFYLASCFICPHKVSS